MQVQSKGNDVTSKILGFVTGGLLAALSLPVWASEGINSRFNMPRGVSTFSASIYDLHMLVFYICVGIGVVVFGAMAYTIYKHRKSRGAEPASFHENTKLEIVWTAIPMAILIIMAIPATAVMIELYDTGGSEMEIEVRGYQWRWQYKYLDEDRNQTLEFFSSMATPREQIENRVVKDPNYLLEVDNPLVIPVNRKIKLLLTANDVIHAWWVPEFGLKRDAIPGILNDVWVEVTEPGIYRGMCAELCGRDHAYMPIVVHALPQDEFDAWYEEQQTAFEERQAMAERTFEEDELMSLGRDVYNRFCASCHMANGQGIPPTFPALDGSPVVRGDRDAHIRLVYEGVPGTAMQAFGGQLNAAELAAVTHFQRHSWSNNVGDITQPVDVLDLMSGQ